MLSYSVNVQFVAKRFLPESSESGCEEKGERRERIRGKEEVQEIRERKRFYSRGEPKECLAGPAEMGGSGPRCCIGACQKQQYLYLRMFNEGSQIQFSFLTDQKVALKESQEKFGFLCVYDCYK